MQETLLRAAADGILAGSAVGLFVFRIRPQLARRRASIAAFILAGGAAAAVPVLLVLAGPGPSVLLAFPTLVLLPSWINPDEFVGLTGGARPADEEARTPARRRIGPGLSWVAVGLAALVGAGPTIANARACIGVELLLPAAVVADPGNEPELGSRALVSQPEPGATWVFDTPMDLDAAAESRHDPDTRAQLIDAGFVVGQATTWFAVDGHHLESDVFYFRDAAGALAFHRAVNRHACQYSNEAFAGRPSGVGLQVRRSTGDPIVEQISWVTGDRRYVVSVGSSSPPPDHARVQNLAAHVLRDLSN